MKKSVILLASAILVISCDVPVGGNKGRLKKEGDVVRYDDQNAPHGTYKPAADTAKAAQHVVMDSAKAVKPEAKPAVAEEPKTQH
ncbi:hypothetical protein [Epilithonimonas mollis]|uniref:Lipoprotein n=1 Tax=Epilithonimonas mollis TaxID=216903 RepID=A0A1M6TF26_9FLAO|nr:hypothetical protein [Epilithonimonas mollis]SHK55615.1 hypothetical protein SAMN05444371_2838 [Epilithonimonas mollis]